MKGCEVTAFDTTRTSRTCYYTRLPTVLRETLGVAHYSHRTVVSVSRLFYLLSSAEVAYLEATHLKIRQPANTYC